MEVAMNRRALLKKGSLLLGAVAAVAGRSSFAHAAVGGKDKSRSRENLKLVGSYLAAWRRKDLKGIAEHLHPNVHFKGPLNDITGKDAVLNAAQRIFPLLIDYGIRSTFASPWRSMISNAPSRSELVQQQNF
jgi:SnoaL-like domain